MTDFGAAAAAAGAVTASQAALTATQNAAWGARAGRGGTTTSRTSPSQHGGEGVGDGEVCIVNGAGEVVQRYTAPDHAAEIEQRARDAIKTAANIGGALDPTDDDADLVLNALREAGLHIIDKRRTR